MKFEIKQVAKDNALNKNTVLVRITSQEYLDAFRKATQDSGKSAGKLAEEMLVHCLKEAGYLKDSK